MNTNQHFQFQLVLSSVYLIVFLCLPMLESLECITRRSYVIVVWDGIILKPLRNRGGVCSLKPIIVTKRYIGCHSKSMSLKILKKEVR